MNAPSPVPPPAGSGDARPYEPSMEEILASIRRIIADDQSLPRPQASEEPAPTEEPVGTVHQLHAPEAEPAVPQPPATAEPPASEDRAMVPQGTVAAPQFAGREGPVASQSVERHEPALSGRLEAIHQQHAEPAIEAYDDPGIDYFDPPEEHDRPTALAAAAPLFSAATNSSVSSAFNVLAASRLADNSDELLGMAREMIRPLLRAWLDENLPSMVERMVRDEIERVARGGH